ncbi:MAG: protein-L-isoaspartate(D-aspartate) O-methyltransferase [Chloroflexota bacterium]|nr:protein-L-isoaspartate(D-aspartate) O-methyltransferase [Chloroflexota bacterium]
MAQQIPTSNFPWAQTWPEITDERVRAAFARVPRAQFVPEPLRQWSERDAPLPIGAGQTISQPFVVALMTQALALQPGEATLEVGTGSGYQTAILCELTRTATEAPGNHIYSVERFAELSQRAAGVLNALGYHPHLAVGDGAAGWLTVAPFAAIIVTAAPAHLPRPLWTQLSEGGRMVIPVGAQSADQMLWLLSKHAGRMSARRLGTVRFVPLLSPLLDDPTQRIQIEED